MAKKKLRSEKIEMTAEAVFKLVIPTENQAAFERDVKRGEICLNAQVRDRGLIFFMEIYPDHFTEGGMKFGAFSKDGCSVKVSGKVVKDIDRKSNADLISALQKNSSLSLFFADVSDSNVNSYYKDGDDSETFELGKIRLLG
jgi:hypothetical protein